MTSLLPTCRGGNFSHKPGSGTATPPHEVRRAQHQAQHSFLGPASGPAVAAPAEHQATPDEPGMSPAACVQARQKLCRSRFRAQRWAAGLELDITISYLLPVSRSRHQVWFKLLKLTAPLFFHIQAPKPKNREHAATLSPDATLNGLSQSRAGHPVGRYATANREGWGEKSMSPRIVAESS